MTNFPRLYARKNEGPYFELARGETVTNSTLQSLARDMGEGWRIWVESAMVYPVGATSTVRRYISIDAKDRKAREELNSSPLEEMPVGIVIR